MSFLTLFRRVFGTHNTAFKIALYFVMAYSVCWFISIFFVAIFQCVPPDHAWNLQPGGKCLNLHAALLGTAAANTLGDIMILILPMPMLVKLNMPKKQKFGVVGVFAVGFLWVFTRWRLGWRWIARANLDQRRHCQRDPLGLFE